MMVNCIAHRGASADYPENTLLAFEQALTQGAHGLELDLQLTQDDQVVVFHDQTLEKAGLPGQAIDNLPLADLQRLEVGSWKNPRFAKEPLPTLEQVLERFGRRTLLLLEIKTFAATVASGRNLELARQVVQAVQRAGVTPQCRVLAFELPVLRHVAQLAPDLATVWNLDNLPPADSLSAADFVAALSLNIDLQSPQQLAQAQAWGKPLMAWVCDHPTQVDLALAHGITYLMTNKPRWLTDYLATP